MDVYLIRHTEVAVGRAISYGQSDVELASNYPEQRDAIWAQLPPEKPAYLFSSPLSRCQLLANDLARSAGVGYPIRFDDRLKELHFGDWEMTPWEAIPRASLDPWMADFVNVGPPNGETFGELAKRVSAFWTDEVAPLAPSTQGPLYIITHGGVIRALLCLFLDLSLQNAYRIHLDYGSLTKLTTNGRNYTIHYVNR